MNLPKLSVLFVLILLANFTSADSSHGNIDEEINSFLTKKYYAEDIKDALMKHINANVDSNNIFSLKDDKTGEILYLEFVKIHDPVRVINDNTYFACTDFRVAGEPKKIYDVDFWLNPENGELEVYDTKIHKEPKKSLLYGWYKQPRYTFVNDKVISLY